MDHYPHLQAALDEIDRRAAEHKAQLTASAEAYENAWMFCEAINPYLSSPVRPSTSSIRGMQHALINVHIDPADDTNLLAAAKRADIPLHLSADDESTYALASPAYPGFVIYTTACAAASLPRANQRKAA